MLKTQLPNKKDWAKQIEDSRRANRITNQELAEASGMSHVTLMKVVNCDSTYDRMQEVEGALRGLIKAQEES